MTEPALYKMIELPEEVISRLEEYKNSRSKELPDNIKEKLLKRGSWEEGLNELKEFVGDDSDGFKTLWELLNIVRLNTYQKYKEFGISDKIFADTMKFCTRYINEQKLNFGSYKFTIAWWFPREMSFLEFRVGALEYEFIDSTERSISLHIPSDANLKRDSVLESIKEFFEFRRKYFKDWKDVRIYTDTWLLAPALKELLDEGSNILDFQTLFDIDYTSPEATWYMSFIYPGHSEPSESLPEKTTLQRRMKKYLLDGNLVGAAKGYLKESVTKDF